MRGWLRVKVFKHLFQHRYDYRSEWLRFTRTIAKPGQYSGVFPLDDNASWEKNAATLRQLHRLRDRIKTLEKTERP